MLKRGPEEQQELRKLLWEKIMANPESKAKIAKDIGISVITLTSFLEKDGTLLFGSFIKIKNYLDKN